jgi:HK97 family phage major capsid protein|nr:MAG TPA_asm: major capsid protein [Caudoviricetes sp.]
MALKAIMIAKKLEMKRAAFDELVAKDAEFETRSAEIEKAIGEAKTEDEQKAVEEALEKYTEEEAAHNEEKEKLSAEIKGLEKDLEDAEKDQPEPKGEPEPKKKDERNDFTMNTINIRSLPMNVRAFDALPKEQRDAIVAQPDVQTFFAELRNASRSKRDVTGGELTIPVVFLDLIAENMYRYSKLMRRIRIRNVNGEARQTIAGTVPEAVWTEMCGAINELTFGFNQITLDGFKVAGYVPVCNSLLEDNDVNLASWIVEMLSEAIGLAKDKAILYGKGAGQKMPLGIVTRLAQESKPSDYPANAPAWVDLHTSNVITIPTDSTGEAFWAALAVAAGNTFTRYSRGERFWAMNSKTLATLQSKAILATALGRYVTFDGMTMPIIGGDVEILEFIPDGDIVGGYGNLYLWAQRSGMTIEASREVQFIQDNTVFRGKERADGMPVIPGAFVAININGASVTTSMVFAADTANNAKLSGLTVGSMALSPAFDSNVLSYSANATAATAAVTATPEMAGAQVAISYNGANVKNGGTVTWLADGKAHPLTVTVKNGNEVMVYTVNVTKAS